MGAESGLALDYRLGKKARTTMDIDLAGPGGEDAATTDLLATGELDLGDHFSFTIERTAKLDQLVEGSAVRYHVRADLAGRLFEEFLLDVGFDFPTGWEPETLHGPDLLAFADIEPVEAPSLPLELQIAEKVHAYTRGYGQSGIASTRVKDLVDLALIASGDPLTEAAAALKRDPGLRLQLVLGGAAFLGGFNERAPLRYTLIVPRQAPIQRGLAQAYDLIRAAPSRFFGAMPRDSVAMSGASRLLFDAALWPTRAGELRDPDHWLRAALAMAEIADILAFAQRLDSDRATARAGYFAEAFGRSDIAASLADLHPKAAVRLGDPAGPLHARDTRFGVRDHLGVAGA